MAVPYRAKDAAAERAEFGHPDVAMMLSILTCAWCFSNLRPSFPDGRKAVETAGLITKLAFLCVFHGVKKGHRTVCNLLWDFGGNATAGLVSRADLGVR